MELFKEGSLDENKYFILSDKVFKNYYEKFCFLNNMIENELGSEYTNKMLMNTYGFTYSNSKDFSDVFTNLVIKHK